MRLIAARLHFALEALKNKPGRYRFFLALIAIAQDIRMSGDLKSTLARFWLESLL
jgi:hypothetical protein